MFNRIILIGNLTKDPEMRYLPMGKPVVNFRIACTTKMKSGDNTKEETLFIDVVVFGKTAENCNRYLAKGSQVLVEGRLKEPRWEKDGMQRSKFEVIGQSVKFLNTRKGAGNAGDDYHVPEEQSDLEPF